MTLPREVPLPARKQALSILAKVSGSSRTSTARRDTAQGFRPAPALAPPLGMELLVQRPAQPGAEQTHVCGWFIENEGEP